MYWFEKCTGCFHLWATLTLKMLGLSFSFPKYRVLNIPFFHWYFFSINQFWKVPGVSIYFNIIENSIKNGYWNFWSHTLHMAKSTRRLHFNIHGCGEVLIGILKCRYRVCWGGQKKEKYISLFPEEFLTRSREILLLISSYFQNPLLKSTRRPHSTPRKKIAFLTLKIELNLKFKCSNVFG